MDWNTLRGDLAHSRVIRHRDVSMILGASPSALGGAATVYDLFGVFKTYNFSADASDADWLATRSDWINVGRDLWAAMAQAAQQANATAQPPEQGTLFDTREIGVGGK